MEKYSSIVLEGMDGSSKYTQSKLLKEKLGLMGHDYELVSFPHYESYSGSLVRGYLRTNKTVNKTMDEIKDDSILYTFNRFQYFSDSGYFGHQEKNYIFDRYTTSNILFQTLDMDIELKEEYVKWITNLEYNILKLPKPDIVIVLRCSETLAINNIQSRGHETDFFESVFMQGKVRGNIDYFVEHHGWIPIDVDVHGEMRTREDINREIMSHLSQ